MATVLVAPLVCNFSVTLLVLHVVWSTSRRSPVLEPGIDSPLAALLRRKAGELQFGGGYPSTIRWQVGYWVESVSASQIEPLVRYLAGQRAHHAQAVAPEPWEQK